MGKFDWIVREQYAVWQYLNKRGETRWAWCPRETALNGSTFYNTGYKTHSDFSDQASAEADANEKIDE